MYISNWIKNEGQRWTGRPSRPTYVIPNPIDTELFKPSSHTDHPKLQVISVRSLERQYGLDLAIKAFSGLDNAELTIVGGGRLLSAYQSLADRLASPVHFVAPKFSPLELAAFYSGFDVFIAPSRTETQGVAMCEAMSCGLPVVAHRIGGIPEFVGNGDSGILVRKGDIRAIRSAIDNLSADHELVRRLGMAARRNIVDKCSIEFIVPKELEILAG